MSCGNNKPTACATQRFRQKLFNHFLLHVRTAWLLLAECCLANAPHGQCMPVAAFAFILRLGGWADYIRMARWMGQACFEKTDARAGTSLLHKRLGLDWHTIHHGIIHHQVCSKKLQPHVQLQAGDLLQATPYLRHTRCRAQRLTGVATTYWQAAALWNWSPAHCCCRSHHHEAAAAAAAAAKGLTWSLAA